MKRHHVLISVMLSLTVGGCGSVTDAYLVDSLTKEPSDHLIGNNPITGNNQYVPGAIDIYTDPFPGDLNPTNQSAPSVTPTAIACAATKLNDPRYYTSDGKECRSAYVYAVSDTADTQSRDKLMDYLIGNSDTICHAHEASFTATSHEANFVLSEGATILGGLGALFTPAATARVLSGSAAMVNATRDNFDQVFFQNMLAPAIVKTIESARLQTRAALVAHRGKDKDTYTVDQMLTDVEDFHSSCSFYVGLVALTNAASRVTASTDEISARIVALTSERENDLSHINSLKALAFAPGSKQDIANQANIVAVTAGVAQLDAQILQLQNQLAFVPSAGGAPAVAVAPPPS